MTTQHYLGVDLGGTNIQAGVVDTQGNVIARSKRRTKPEVGLEGVVDRIEKCARKACEKAEVEIEELTGIGIGSPGGVDPVSGMVQDAENLFWKDVPLARLLSQRFSKPVHLENDVNCAAIAEARFGAGRGSQAMIVVWVGTGIGGGIVLNGSLYRGAFGTAGEIGQMLIAGFGSDMCSTLETHCARSAIARQVQAAIADNPNSVIHELLRKKADEDDADPRTLRITSNIIARAHAMEDPAVREILDRATTTIARTVASVVSLLSLDCVVIGGGLGEAMGDALSGPIADRARPLIFPRKTRDVRIVTSKLLDNAGIIGAALGESSS
ncbi:MAG: ROK family protein [Phycisphaeraceae bacterium]|nr:ROK family protein [Phycisphaerales bacterium]MCB9859374.1 ROK family protein [Phycisphaeraceae bacterium]